MKKLLVLLAVLTALLTMLCACDDSGTTQYRPGAQSATQGSQQQNPDDNNSVTPTKRSGFYYGALRESSLGFGSYSPEEFEAAFGKAENSGESAGCITLSYGDSEFQFIDSGLDFAYIENDDSFALPCGFECGMTMDQALALVWDGDIDSLDIANEPEAVLYSYDEESITCPFGTLEMLTDEFATEDCTYCATLFASAVDGATPDTQPDAGYEYIKLYFSREMVLSSAELGIM